MLCFARLQLFDRTINRVFQNILIQNLKRPFFSNITNKQRRISCFEITYSYGSMLYRISLNKVFVNIYILKTILASAEQLLSLRSFRHPLNERGSLSGLITRVLEASTRRKFICHWRLARLPRAPLRTSDKNTFHEVLLASLFFQTSFNEIPFSELSNLYYNFLYTIFFEEVWV